MTDNVYSTAKILEKETSSVQKYELGAFVNNGGETQEDDTTSLNNVSLQSGVQKEAIQTQNTDSILGEIKNLQVQMQNLSDKVEQIDSSAILNRDIDAQVVQAIKDLKQYASFFEQASFQLETKILKTSISLAKKIINIEVGENSTLIAKQTIEHLLEKVKSASKIQIHLNPKDYEILKHELQLDKLIELRVDPNVSAGGVVVASDLGNYDGSIEAKISTVLEALDTLV